jgi:predicted DNA-binding transcriptional regulator YafY
MEQFQSRKCFCRVRELGWNRLYGKNRTMLRQHERILQLDSLLRNRERTTAKVLATALEVSDRTIRDNITFLRDRWDAPIAWSRAKGYFYTDPNWRLPTVPLTQGELFALMLAARMLETYAGSSYQEELQTAITQLSQRLPEQTWVDLQQVAQERILFRSGVETDLNPDVWRNLEEACRQQRSVQMTYYTASRNAQSDRKFDPYLLHIYRGTNPYVIGYCHNRQATRWFRVDRIRHLECLQNKFIRDPNFNAKTHLEMIFQHEVGSQSFEVMIWFDRVTAPYIRERRWHRTQTLEEHPDGSVTLGMTVSGLNDLKRWVLGYGKGAIVREPTELVELVKDEVAGMARHYFKDVQKG